MEDTSDRHIGLGCGCLLIAVPLFIVFLIVDILWGAQLGIYSSDGDPHVPAPTTHSSSPSPMPSLIDDPSQPDWQIVGGWYCWNTGPLGPHYIGHHVPGDHLCTWGELRSIGFAAAP